VRIHRNPKTFAGILALIIILIIAFSIPASAQKTAFNSQDALSVKSLRIADISDDGRYIAATISSRSGRLNVDHKRYGDPTYISPRLQELVVIDTESKQQTPVFRDMVQVSGMTWSPDGRTLAFFLQKGDGFFLHTFEAGSKKVREIKLKTDSEIASNSFLEWTRDGTGVFLGLREDGWREKARAMYIEASEGPIIVYDSKKPFLKWEEIRNMNALHVPVKVDLKSRNVTELLPGGNYGNFRQAESGAFMTYVRNYPLKTDYTRRGGTEYELMMLDLQNGGEPKVLREKEEKRLNLTWSDDNTTYAWTDKGDILVQSVFDEEPRNLTKDKVKPTGDDTAKVKFSVMRWSRDGSKLLAGTKKGYWLADVQSGDIEMVFEFPEEETGEDRHRNDPRPRDVVGWSPDGRHLYLSTSATDKWERGYARFDLQGRKMTDLVKDANLYGGWRMSKDGEKIFYNFSDGDMPNELYMTDKDFRVRTCLTDLNPWIANKKLTRSELVRYLDVDGNELYGILYYPVDYEPGKKYPLVCEVYEKFFHNGFNSNMNLFANAGFFGFRPSVHLVVGYPGEAWVKGVTAGINKLIDRGLVDGGKLGIQGGSYGGYATNLIIAQTDRFAAAINISGKVNIISFLGDSPRIGTRNYAAAEVGQDRLGVKLWEAPLKYVGHSAVMLADRIETPLLLLTGEGDWNVPAATTRGMYYALRRLGKECVWVNYWNGGHGAGAASNEVEFHDHWNRIIEWYQTHFDKSEK